LGGLAVFGGLGGLVDLVDLLGLTNFSWSIMSAAAAWRVDCLLSHRL
jgi:hypothetical protein